MKMTIKKKTKLFNLYLFVIRITIIMCRSICIQRNITSQGRDMCRARARVCVYVVVVVINKENQSVSHSVSR